MDSGTRHRFEFSNSDVFDLQIMKRSQKDVKKAKRKIDL